MLLHLKDIWEIHVYKNTFLVFDDFPNEESRKKHQAIKFIWRNNKAFDDHRSFVSPGQWPVFFFIKNRLWTNNSEKCYVAGMLAHKNFCFHFRVGIEVQNVVGEIIKYGSSTSSEYCDSLALPE